MKDKIQVDVSVRTVRTHRLHLDDGAIMSMLKTAGVEIPEDAYDFRLYVTVPGGGDWSHTDLDVDKGTPLKVFWRTREGDD